MDALWDARDATEEVQYWLEQAWANDARENDGTYRLMMGAIETLIGDIDGLMETERSES